MSGPRDPMETVTTARVQLTLELELHQPWPETATLADVYRRAAQQAEEEIRYKLRTLVGVLVVGEAKVVAVLAQRRRP